MQPLIVSTKLFSPPATEPVTLDEAKAHLRFNTSFTDDDAVITGMIKAARSMVETEVKLVLITQTWDVAFDGFPSRPLGNPNYDPHNRECLLPFGPLQSIASITYVDAGNIVQTLDPAYYNVVSGLPGGFSVAPYYVFPVIQRMITNPVRVRQVCGFGTAADVPEVLKLGLKMLVAHLYEHRGDTDEDIPKGIKRVLWCEDWGCYR